MTWRSALATALVLLALAIYVATAAPGDRGIPEERVTPRAALLSG